MKTLLILMFMLGMVCSNTATTPSSLTTTPKPKVKDIRLPLSLYPVYYDLELQPNLYEGPAENFTFDGHVRIQLRCDTSTNNITLHTNKLTIKDATLEVGAEPGTPTAPSIVRWEWDKDRQFMIIHLNGTLVENGFYYVKMNFSGPLKDDLHGLYLSRYESNNTTFYLASTQFSPTDARKAFPCFDEPSIKSHFNITLVRKSHVKSLSNMPVARTENRENGWIADIYHSTPKMATYVLAFIVCDFDFRNATTKNNVTFKAWSRPEAINQTTYALDIGVKILTYFEEYFETRFSLPKQDIIAIPDMSFEGMENWGLTAFQETAMLYEPGVSSKASKQWEAVMVSHEIGHQWFGDLVSPSWWDDVWLKEGFASYAEYMGVDFLHPDWKMFDQFAVNYLQYAFDIDGLVSSHPVYVPVSSPDEIIRIFDDIVYYKGACLMRMMRFFLGEETFRQGLIKYLKRKEYDSAVHDELWQALTDQSAEDFKNINVKDVMDTWLLQMNYPVVTVTREGNSRIRVTQERYLQDPHAVDPGKFPSHYKWEIPFTFTSSKDNNFNKTDADIYWIRKNTPSVSIDNQAVVPDQSDNTSWIVGNPMQHGYYRVNYDTQNWQALINQLKTDHTKIHPINRAQIINDAWSLAKAGMLPQEVALQTTEYLNQELDYLPWNVADKEITYVDKMLTNTPLYGAFQAFMASKITGPFNAFGMNNTGATHIESMSRSHIVATACHYGVERCVEESVRIFRQWMENSDSNPIHPELKGTVYCTAIRHGGIAEWNFAFQQYKTGTVAAESARLLTSMGCARTKTLIRFLFRALVRDQVRKHDALAALQQVSNNPIARGLVWALFRRNYDSIRKNYGSAFFAISRVIGEMASDFKTHLELEQLLNFMESHQPDQDAGTAALQQAVEKTKANIEWMENNLQIVQTWLRNLGFQ